MTNFPEFKIVLLESHTSMKTFSLWEKVLELFI